MDEDCSIPWEVTCLVPASMGRSGGMGPVRVPGERRGAAACFQCASPVETTSSGRHNECRTRCGSRTAAKRATTARCLAARAAVDRHGPGRDNAPHRSTGTENGQGREGEEVRYALHGEAPEEPPPLPRSPARGITTSTMTTACKSSVAPDQTGSCPCLVLRSGCSGTLWSRSSTPLCPCRCSMLVCRWWWTSRWTS